MVPASGVVGALIPLPPPFNIATLYGASILGAEGRRRIVPKLDSAAMLELCILLEDDYAAVSPSNVMDVQRKFKLPDDVFADIRVEIFARFMTAMLKNPEFKSAELRELSALYSTLNLNPEQLSDALYAGFEDCWKANVQWTSTKDLEDPESLERMTMDKCLFLVTRCLKEHDSAEGLAYTAARMAKQLQCDVAEVKDRTLEIAYPLYEKAVDTVVEKLDKVTPENVAKARNSLGLSVEDVDFINNDCYRNEVVAWFEAHDDTLMEDGVERLNKLATVLSIEDEVAEDILLEEIFPVFQFEVQKILEGVVKDPASSDLLVGKLAKKQLDLSLSLDHAQTALLQALSDTVAKPYQEAGEFLNLGNTKGALRSMRSLLESNNVAKLVLDTLIDSKMVEEAEFDKFFERVLPRQEARVSDELFKLLLKDSIDSGVSELVDSTLELGAMMGVPESAMSKVLFDVCGPMLADKIDGYLAGGMDSLMNPELKQELADFAASVGGGIPAEVYGKVALSAYKAQLDKVPPNVQEPGQLQARQELMDATRFFLALGDAEWEEAVKLHVQSGAALFEDSVKEALEAGNGVVSPQFAEGLEKLGAVLMLPPQAQKELRLRGVKEALKPRAEKLVISFEKKVLSKEDFEKRRGATNDEGEDFTVDPNSGQGLGLDGAGGGKLEFMDEVLNMVDFFEANGLWVAPERKVKKKKAVVKEEKKEEEESTPEVQAEASEEVVAEKEEEEVKDEDDAAEEVKAEAEESTEEAEEESAEEVEASVEESTQEPEAAAEEPVAVAEEEEEEEEEEEQGEIQYTYELSMQGMFENDLIVEDMYRQFTVAALQELAAKQQAGGASLQIGSVSDRLEKAKTHFGGMLGMSPGKKAGVDKDMGRSVYGNYVSTLLKQKGSVDAQDFGQLASIQQTMGMDEDFAIDLLWTMKKEYLGNFVENAFMENTDMDGETAREIKAAADKIGVDLVDDLDLPDKRAMQLFLAESVDAIVTGTATDQNKELIGDFQEAWGVPEDKAEEAFLKMVAGKCDDSGASAAAYVGSSGSEREAIKELDTLVAFAPFASEEYPGVSVDGGEATKAKLLDLYAKAKDMGDEDDEGAADAKAALEKATAILDSVLKA